MNLAKVGYQRRPGSHSNYRYRLLGGRVEEPLKPALREARLGLASRGQRSFRMARPLPVPGQSRAATFEVRVLADATNRVRSILAVPVSASSSEPTEGAKVADPRSP